MVEAKGRRSQRESREKMEEVGKKQAKEEENGRDKKSGRGMGNLG